MALDGIVRIESEGGFSNGTRVTNAETGEEIQGISGVSIEIKSNDVVRAKIELCSVQIAKVDAAPSYLVASPTTGDMKAVKKIEFADGEVISF